MPKDLRVAVAGGELPDDRIALELRERAAVGAVGEALHGRIAGGGVEEDERRLALLAEATRILPIDDGAAAEHRPYRVGREGLPELFPVDEIPAYRMPPVHVAPAPAVGIVLEEEVVFPCKEDEAVGVVVPAAARGEVKLPAERLGVEGIGRAWPEERVGLLDGSKRGRVLGELVDDEGDVFSLPGRDLHRGPPVGRAVGELDVVSDHCRAIDEERHDALRSAVFDRNLEEPSVGNKVAADELERPFRLRVGLDDLVDIDVPPAPRRGIDHAQRCGLPGELRHIPRLAEERLAPPWSVVAAGGAAHRLSVNEQLESELVGIVATADQKGDERPLDPQRRRGERAGAVVAAKERIDEPPSKEAVDGHLPREGSPGRLLPKSRSLDGPRAVGVAVEVGDHEVSPRRVGRRHLGGSEKHAGGAEPGKKPAKARHGEGSVGGSVVRPWTGKRAAIAANRRASTGSSNDAHRQGIKAPCQEGTGRIRHCSRPRSVPVKTPQSYAGKGVESIEPGCALAAGALG